MQIIQSKLLNNFSEISHGFTTKEHSNLAFHVGDNTKCVIQNHQALSDLMKYDKTRLVHMKQIHSNLVKRVDNKDNFSNPPTCDALITDKKKTALMVMVADCSPILFYDPKRQVIAVAHAGRAGAFLNIIQKVCDSFEQEFNSSCEDIIVSVGCSIKECCYEVGEEVYREAQGLNLEYSLSKRHGNDYLNIESILHKQLLAAGIQESNIEFSNECSCCSSDKYYSYRAQNITGRFSGLIYLT